MMRSLVKALSLLGVATLVACTAIVTSDDAVQCTTDGDCTKRGPDFVDSTCSNGLCVAKASSQQDASTDPDASSLKPAIPNAECTTNAECARKDAGFVCSSNIGKCAPTTSDDCEVVYGDPTAEGTVLYGMLSDAALNDTNYFRQTQYSRSAKLAFQEFFENAGATFKGRKAALISCSEHFPRRSAALLANAGVKVVIGPGSEDHQVPVVETLLPAKIPSFTPWINGNPASVKSAELSWLAGFERAEVLPPLNALVAEREAAFKAATGKSKIRIAVIVNEPSGDFPTTVNGLKAYGELLDQRLLLNGKSAIENTNDTSCGAGNACYKRFISNQNEAAVVTQRAKDIVAFAPDIIIPFTDIEWAPQLLPSLEAELASKFANEADKPMYLHPFLQIEETGYKTLAVGDATTGAALRARIGGIRAVRDNSFELFTTKFKAALTTASGPGTDPNPGAGRAFETSLLLLLATYAAFEQSAEPTPAQILAALPKVTDKAGPRVTLTDLVSGISTLNQQKPINFDGLFSFFDLDYTQHTAPATWTTWCVTSVAQYESSGRIFKDGKFDGTAAACP